MQGYKSLSDYTPETVDYTYDTDPFGGGPNFMGRAQALLMGGMYGSGVSFAPLGGEDEGVITAATIETEPASTMIDGILTSDGFSRAGIVINSSEGAPWFWGYPDRFNIAGRRRVRERFGGSVQDIYRAITLLHELGHAFDFLWGWKTTKLDTLGELNKKAGASQENSKKVFRNCIR